MDTGVSKSDGGCLYGPGPPTTNDIEIANVGRPIKAHGTEWIGLKQLNDPKSKRGVFLAVQASDHLPSPVRVILEDE